MNFSYHRALLLSVLIGATSFVQAADPLTDAVQNAYAPYREALFKTNGQSQPEAAQAMARAQEAWAKIIERFGMKAPAPYDRDPLLGSSLAEVSKVYEKASAYIAAKDLPSAHEALEHAREAIAEMRHRNNVITYSDHMNAYHAKMEVVMEHATEMLKASDGRTALAFEVGVLDYLAERLSSEAPADLAKNEEFRALLRNVEKSVADLKTALVTNKLEDAQTAIGKLKAPYSRLFVKFG